MALIDSGSIDALNNADVDNPAGLATTLMRMIFGALHSYILPTAFFLIMAYGIWGAIQYFTAYGDETKAAKGRSTMTYAIIGGIIVAAAWIIVKYVMRVIGSNATIPTS